MTRRDGRILVGSGIAAVIACACLLAMAVFAPAAAQSPGQVSALACNKMAFHNSSDQRAVLVSSGKAIYVCGYLINSTSAVTGQIVYGTGTTCQTGTVSITPAYQLSPVVSDPSPFFRGMYVPPGNDLCFVASSASAVQATVYYAQER